MTCSALSRQAHWPSMRHSRNLNGKVKTPKTRKAGIRVKVHTDALQVLARLQTCAEVVTYPLRMHHVHVVLPFKWHWAPHHKCVAQELCHLLRPLSARFDGGEQCKAGPYCNAPSSYRSDIDACPLGPSLRIWSQTSDELLVDDVLEHMKLQLYWYIAGTIWQ